MVALDASFTFDTIRIDGPLKQVFCPGFPRFTLKDPDKPLTYDLTFLLRIRFTQESIEKFCPGVYYSDPEMSEYPTYPFGFPFSHEPGIYIDWDEPVTDSPGC